MAGDMGDGRWNRECSAVMAGDTKLIAWD